MRVPRTNPFEFCHLHMALPAWSRAPRPLPSEFRRLLHNKQEFLASTASGICPLDLTTTRDLSLWSLPKFPARADLPFPAHADLPGQAMRAIERVRVAFRERAGTSRLSGLTPTSLAFLLPHNLSACFLKVCAPVVDSLRNTERLARGRPRQAAHLLMALNRRNLYQTNRLATESLAWPTVFSLQLRRISLRYRDSQAMTPRLAFSPVPRPATISRFRQADLNACFLKASAPVVGNLRNSAWPARGWPRRGARVSVAPSRESLCLKQRLPTQTSGGLLQVHGPIGGANTSRGEESLEEGSCHTLLTIRVQAAML